MEKVVLFYLYLKHTFTHETGSINDGFPVTYQQHLFLQVFLRASNK